MTSYAFFKIFDYVSHERLEGEVIAIDTRNGCYFNLGETAADCWTLLADGWPLEIWSTILEMKYGAGVFNGIDDFILKGLNFELFQTIDADPSKAMPNPSSSALPDDHSRSVWSNPEIVRFDDLQDLIKIDPIHDTSTFGWPSVATSDD